MLKWLYENVYGNIMLVILLPIMVVGEFILLTIMTIYGICRHGLNGHWDLESVMREWHLKPPLKKQGE